MSEDLEAAYLAALEKVRKPRATETDRVAYRAARDAFAAARSASRVGRVSVSANGKVAVVPKTVAATTDVKPPGE